MLLPLVLSVALATSHLADVEAPDHVTTSTSGTPNNEQGQPDQTPAEGKTPPPLHTGLRSLFRGYIDDLKHLPAVENMYVALIGGAGAIAVHPFDQTLNAHLRSHYTLVNDIWAPAKYYGDTPEQVALSLGTYAFGRAFDHPKVSHLAMDLIRAQLVAETLVEPLKFATHRLRPDGSNFQSFPSGHAAVTFAGATVLQRHLGWKRSALAYAIAAYVSTSRLHDNVHYISDVTFGAAVGTIAGRTVTQHGRNYWTFIPVSVPSGGAAIVAARQF
jgi:hypothetical protein